MKYIKTFVIIFVIGVIILAIWGFTLMGDDDEIYSTRIFEVVDVRQDWVTDDNGNNVPRLIFGHTDTFKVKWGILGEEFGDIKIIHSERIDVLTHDIYIFDYKDITTDFKPTVQIIEITIPRVPITEEHPVYFYPK